MNKQGKEYFSDIGWVYYDSILTEAFSPNPDGIRKFYKLKRFAAASCKAKYGHSRAMNRKYRQDFMKRVDVSNCEIHHGLDGRLYAIPKEIHRKIPHFGYVALLEKS